MDPDSTITILRAADFAARKHRAQRRKGADAAPYINHPLEVALLVATVGGITDPDVLAAAILHDTVEDTTASREELVEEFNERTASIVMEVTDDKSLPKPERKRMQVEHAPHLSSEAKVVKLADKISNIEDIMVNPPEGWSIERRLEYITWGESVVAGLRGVSPDLERVFDRLASQAKAEID